MVFCNDITPTCDVCFEVLYGECNDVLTISLGLDASTTFFLNLTDKFDIVTPLTVTTDGSGDFTITQTWTQFFGDVEVEIFSDSGRTIPIVFIQNSIVYHCVILTQELSGSNNITPPDSFDDDSETYFTAGAITDIREKDVANTLIVGLKANNLFSKMVGLYLMSPTSLAAAAVNAKTPGTHDITYVNTPTHSANGVDFNGTTQYGDTNITPSTDLTLNDTHLSQYNRENTTTAGDTLSSRQAASALIAWTIRRAVDIMDIFMYNTGAGALTGVSNTRSDRLNLLTRRSITDMEVYRDGVSLATSIIGGGALPNEKLYISARNQVGVASFFDSREIVFDSVGLGLTNAEAIILTNLVDIYQRNVIFGGRNV